MQKRNDTIIYSASDLTAFLKCPHLTTLNLVDLNTPLERALTDENIELIQNKGFVHESDYLSTLRTAGNTIFAVSSTSNWNEQLAATQGALTSGADVIFQAALSGGIFIGHADFLRRVEVPSTVGTWSYEVADTKLAHRPKPTFMIQLAHYSELLATLQGAEPAHMHLVLGNHAERSFRVSDYIYYYQRLRQRFNAFVEKHPATAPEKCDHCNMCDWRERCAAEWETVDHLNQVADISKVQIKRLHQNGIHTLAQLGELKADITLSKVRPDTLARLRAQAALQLKKRVTGISQLELLPHDPHALKGFNRLPPPTEGDLFFDMEGDPLHEGGLEYLFGIYYRNQGEWTFLSFWAHDRREEKNAFSNFVDFVIDHLSRNPHAHIYHYAHYEPTALKRLMSLHGIREAEIDQLLRDGKFVDLYRVVRESIRVSEPRYSLKNLETFYMDKREREVTSAGASIVYYEKWRQTRNDDLLCKILDYNKDDCISTQLLRQWLIDLKPQANTWIEKASNAAAKSEKSDKICAHEARLADYESAFWLAYLQSLANGVANSDCEFWYCSCSTSIVAPPSRPGGRSSRVAI